MDKNIKDFFSGKGILVIGGTGTIGSEIVNQLLICNPRVIRIFTNSENELWETQLRFDQYSEKLRFLLGDIRDYDRVLKAMEDIDIIFNAAAIKHVHISEYNPMEAITVNLIGLSNIIEAAINKKVRKIIQISTDKAVSPTTVMGATKMIGEKLCLSRYFSKGTHDIAISCVRFGNVLGSRGSIIPLIKEQLRRSNEIFLTSKEMRRFFMSISEAVELVLKAAMVSINGEIFVLKMPTVQIKDLMEVIVEEYCPTIGKNPQDIKIIETKPKPGEKFDEELVSEIEQKNCFENEDMLVIIPSFDFDENDIEQKIAKIGKPLSEESYGLISTKNATPLTKSEIKKILKYLKFI
ncbi:MAG: SDR family NAD(P)-dependent oxidoreductase [Candidatus Lokiarchaeota archaeon]|nr:SDR family NAD(P)-dependent oxidoreductase [Candidatus Lokiarchaeota archaeon]